MNCCCSCSLFPIAISAEVEDREAVTRLCHSGTMLADAAAGTTHFQDVSVQKVPGSVRIKAGVLHPDLSRTARGGRLVDGSLGVFVCVCG